MEYFQFNEKYKDYLEKGFDGLEFNHPEFNAWLDEKFQEFIKQPDFKFSQIKVKFGQGRFYCEGLSIHQVNMVENKINSLWK